MRKNHKVDVSMSYIETVIVINKNMNADNLLTHSVLGIYIYGR